MATSTGGRLDVNDELGSDDYHHIRDQFPGGHLASYPLLERWRAASRTTASVLIFRSATSANRK